LGAWSEPIVVSVVCAGFALALYGWGALGERVLRSSWPWPMTLCVGLLLVMFLGGVANVFHVARAGTLDAIAVAGLLLAVGSTGLDRRAGRSRERPAGGAPAVTLLRAVPGASLVLAAFVFQVMYLTPPAAFNPFDDFETYLPLPLRMLQTGTLDAGPLNFVGIYTLGALAFLQGFVVAHWPVVYADAIDSLFGLALCATLILVAGLRAGLPGWLTALAVALVIAITPQYVNISAQYMGSALLLFVLLLHLGVDRDRAPLDLTSTACAVATGMAYAGLVALKATFGLVVVIHFALAATAIALAHRGVRTLVTWCGTVVLSGSVFLLPWLLVHAYKLLPAIVAGSVAKGPAVPVATPAPGVEPWSTEPLFYGFGASQAHYAALAAFALLCALLTAMRARRGPQADTLVAPCILAGTLTLPVVYFAHLALVAGPMGPATALRYATPVFIAIVPAALVLSASVLAPGGAVGPSASARRWPALALLGVAAAGLLWSFSGPLLNRAGLAIRSGSAVSFLFFQPPAKQFDFLRYNRLMFEGFTRERMQKLQDRVPAGATLLTYVSSSLYFDFSRNRILAADAGGLGAPWLHFPFEGSVDDAGRFLREQGVGYVLWEYQGYAVQPPHVLADPENFPSPVDRRLALVKLRFSRVLEALSERSEVLYDDGSFRLFRIR